MAAGAAGDAAGGYRQPMVVEVLRSAERMATQDFRIGGKVSLEMEEIEVKGWATVSEVSTCPKLEDGPGRGIMNTSPGKGGC